nr:putative ORF1 [Marmot picobirnavirus]
MIKHKKSFRDSKLKRAQRMRKLQLLLLNIQRKLRLKHRNIHRTLQRKLVAMRQINQQECLSTLLILKLCLMLRSELIKPLSLLRITRHKRILLACKIKIRKH